MNYLKRKQKHLLTPKIKCVICSNKTVTFEKNRKFNTIYFCEKCNKSLINSY